MAGKHVTPAVGLSAFSCPHCGTLTSQNWYPFYSEASKDPYTVWRPERVTELFAEHGENEDLSEEFWKKVRRLSSGELFLESTGWDGRNRKIENLAASSCRECQKIAVWIYDRLLWPVQNQAPEPNPDLPGHILPDYLEAGSILASSPRGTAALLRLCLQKLCTHILGADSKKTIDEDITTLVARGLDRRIQQALDIVRVVGNESVHPGTMDLKDDRTTAEELFRLINIVVEDRISQPRRIEELYAALPANKVKAIEERNSRLLPKPDKK